VLEPQRTAYTRETDAILLGPGKKLYLDVLFEHLFRYTVERRCVG
jgi:hypothetical protein